MNYILCLICRKYVMVIKNGNRKTKKKLLQKYICNNIKSHGFYNFEKEIINNE